MKVFIANFPFDLTETDIYELFKIFGEIVDCKLITDPESGKSRGFGFIEFRGRRQARLAMKKYKRYGDRRAPRCCNAIDQRKHESRAYKANKEL